MEQTYVILVNWNGWRDTVECLESLLRIDHANYVVVVCDNGSRDGSIERICAWADGALAQPPGSSAPIQQFTSPPIVKPVRYVSYSRASAEAGGRPDDPRLVVVDVGANLGFAGGNNVGLRYALARGDMKAAWLLNNDTVVEPKSLSALEERMAADQKIGMCGSVLVDYNRPDTIQALGGAWYSPWTTRAFHLGAGERFPESIPRDPSVVEGRTTYVVGASMLVSAAFLRVVGLMQEDYFLYGEEIDWAARGRGLFRLGFAPASVVYHKVGASTPKATTKDAWALELLYANKLRATRRFYSKFLWVNYCWYLLEVARAFARGDHIRARSIYRALFGREIAKG